MEYINDTWFLIKLYVHDFEGNSLMERTFKSTSGNLNSHLCSTFNIVLVFSECLVSNDLICRLRSITVYKHFLSLLSVILKVKIMLGHLGSSGS